MTTLTNNLFTKEKKSKWIYKCTTKTMTNMLQKEMSWEDLKMAWDILCLRKMDPHKQRNIDCTFSEHCKCISDDEQVSSRSVHMSDIR